MSEENKQKSFPWKTVGYFDSFEAADKKRSELLETFGELQVKVKRCGESGKIFMVKERINPEDAPKIEKKKRNKQKREK